MVLPPRRNKNSTAHGILPSRRSIGRNESPLHHAPSSEDGCDEPIWHASCPNMSCWIESSFSPVCKIVY